MNKDSVLSELHLEKQLIKCLFISNHVVGSKATKMNNIWSCPFLVHTAQGGEKERFKYESQCRGTALTVLENK